jgi:tetratricopeptide (TPR) repeat protein
MDLVERQDYIHFHFSEAEEQNSRAVEGFYCLGDLATNAIPALIDMCTNPPSEFSKDAADNVLMAIYPASAAAILYWVPVPERAEWYNEAGEAKSQLGALSNAIIAFSQAIRLDPTNVPACLNRANARMQLQDFPGALLDAQRTMELDSSNQPAFSISGICKYSLKDFKGADADFTIAVNLETNDVNAYNYRGLARVKLQELDAALADFNQAAALAPREATIYRNRALVEAMQKEYELALADASKSIDLDGKDPMAYLLRGHVRKVLKEYESARMDDDKAVELSPNNPATYAARGSVKMSMDDFESAGEDVERALELDPKNANAYLVRGCIKGKRGGEDNDALADLERAVELDPKAPEAYGMLGLFQYKFSQWGPALENCHRALELGALNGEADLRSYIWLIRAQTGEEADADKDFETYLKSLPGAKTNDWDASIARFLSGSLPESNFLAQATTTAKRPSDVKGQVCESLYYAGMKRKLAGDKQGALELFQKCLDTKDDNNFGYLNAGVEMRAVKN